MKRAAPLALLPLLLLLSCAQLGRQYTQRDAVTGKQVINKYTLDQEIAIGKLLEKQFVEQAKAEGHQVDVDQVAIARVGRIIRPIIEVCHLPKLPWRYHVTSSAEWNAFATVSGLVFVHKGILDDVSDEELAAILGHEVAHVTCRHITEGKSQEEVSGLFSRKAGGAYYRASFSTAQEAEADRVGLLYAALAGFDPTNVYKVWIRAHEKFGERSDYLHDHPLSRDRATTLQQLAPTAAKYFAGHGVVNLKTAEILVNNEIAPYQARPDDPDAAFLSAALSEYLRHKETAAEAKQREQAAAAQAERKRQALKFMSAGNVKLAPTRDGKQGVFADIKNGSNTLMKRMIVEFYYVGDDNKVLYQEKLLLENVKSGETRTSGLYYKNVAGTKRVSIAVVEVDY